MNGDLLDLIEAGNMEEAKARLLSSLLAEAR